MKLTKASVEIVDSFTEEEVLKKLELAGRVCYKSEDKINEESAERFIKSLIKRGHESVIEHFSFTVKFIIDRGVSHELVRHRLSSFSQESTRYCCYDGGEMSFIVPCFYLEKGRSKEYDIWLQGCLDSEKNYNALLAKGSKAQEARTVLNNSLKTEVYMTSNLRQWRLFLKLRTDFASHPQMREVADQLLVQLKEKLPTIFGNIT